ncbi:MAG: SDR family oxidoreductase [Bacillus sp. (in: Bacteria)]|nr:SDR family oxidoreductase [Bacillus sp. (in: firmicutes)]
MTKDKPIILVTGANSGIGKATAMAFAKENAHVVMLCRNKDKGKAVQEEIIATTRNTDVDLLICDFSHLENVRRVAKEVNDTYDRLDVLVNNAAVISLKRKETRDGNELQFGVNHLAPFLLTNLLLPLMVKSAPSRIVNVSSGAHKIGDISFSDLQSLKKYRTFKAYGQSKLANILFTYELARRIQGTGVTVNALHPGAVATSLGVDRQTGFGKSIVRMLKPFFQTPEEGASTSIYLGHSPEVEGVSGKYFMGKKEVSSSRLSYDEGVAKKLWEVSEKLTGLNQ